MASLVRKHSKTTLLTRFSKLTMYMEEVNFMVPRNHYISGDDVSYHPLPTDGDGSIIRTKYLELALSITERTQVLIKWEKGDIVLLDVSKLESIGCLVY